MMRRSATGVVALMALVLASCAPFTRQNDEYLGGKTLEIQATP